MPDYLSLNDTELTELVRENDGLAFKEIFRRYNRQLIVYAHKKLKDTDEAQDVVQDVFAEFWDNRERFRINTTLAAYLHKSTLNRVLNIFRHKKVSEKYFDQLELIINASADTCDHYVREKDLAELVEKEIQALPAAMRNVFEMSRKEFLPNKEIASRLNLSDHTIATQIKKSLKILRMRLRNSGIVSIFFSVLF